jgi:ribosomal protein S18 acetylase RimI-like enzyme
MKKSTKKFWIKLREYIDYSDYEHINKLKKLCEKTDGVLKLELDYKLKDSQNAEETYDLSNINEFMCYDDEILVGYIGICSFGNHSYPLELMGMVHPEYRKQGIFTRLNQMALGECRRRSSVDFYLLCDRKSETGKIFLTSLGAKYNYSEFEMYLDQDIYNSLDLNLDTLSLRKATNDDAYEVTRQNKIYFEDIDENTCVDIKEDELLFPEEEEKRGLTIFIAEYNDKVVGKVNIQVDNGIGGIYGLGILPNYRGQGFGRELLMMAVEELKKLRVERIMLQVEAENSTALNLYKSCGFVEESVMDYYFFR